MSNTKTDNNDQVKYFENITKEKVNFTIITEPDYSGINYISHPSIVISSDDEFGNYSSSGIGTVEDPYLIEGYNISTTNQTGILIQDTTKYFMIQNCIIDAGSTGIKIENVTANTPIVQDNICHYNSFAGIYARDILNIQILNNTCDYNSYYGMRIINCNASEIKSNLCKSNYQGGITIDSCFSIEIKKNTVSSNGYSAGILLDNSAYALVDNNTCYNNENNGVRIRDSPGVLFLNNYIFNNNSCTGVEIYHSFNVCLLSNTIFSDSSSIAIVDSTDTQIVDNYLYWSGLEISGASLIDWYSYTITNNLINDKKLGFFINMNDMTFSEPLYGQFILVDCQEIVIENQGIEDEFVGVTLHFCTDITLQKLRIISSVSNVRIKVWGIRVYNSESIVIKDNICKDGGWGIYFRNVIDSTVKSNLCENNKVIGMIIIDSDKITIINNTLSLNKIGGIRLSNTDDSDITFNQIEENGYGGIFIPGGLYLDHDSDRNVIHHNSFINNNQTEGSQAKDDGDSNTWYEVKSQIGNYWDNWSQTGPYSISGDSNSTDPYPLSEIPVYEEPKKTTFNFTLIILPIIAITILQLNAKKRR